MNTLEMILEEIDNIEKEYDTERYHQYFVDGASCVISDIRAFIRSHMNDAKDLNVPILTGGNDGRIKEMSVLRRRSNSASLSRV